MYKLTSLVPAANVCTCENGKGATAAQCPVDGESKCVSCDHGYDLQMDNTCVGSFSMIHAGVVREDVASVLARHRIASPSRFSPHNRLFFRQ